MQEILRKIFPDNVKKGLLGFPIGTPLENILKRLGNEELSDYFVRYDISLQNGHEMRWYFLVDLSKNEKPLRTTNVYYNHNLKKDPDTQSFDKLAKEIQHLLTNELGSPTIDESSLNMKIPDLIWSFEDENISIRYAMLIYKAKTLTHINKVLKLTYSGV